MIEIAPTPVNRLNGADDAAKAGAGAAPLFTPLQIEEIAFRRFNPFAALTASSLSMALDEFEVGNLMPAARLWQGIVARDDRIPNVKEKREEAVALRTWSVQPLEESPAAEDQAAVLKNFYQNARAGHALNRHVAGGAPLLFTQMMDCVAYFYAVHHIIWQPDAAKTFNLPSGKAVPNLAAIFEYVPLEFFEARTGALRFLGLYQTYTGKELEPLNWLITTGPGLMRAASILHYYKRLATHDLINFSEKFGTPGIVVHTTAQQGSPEGQAALALSRGLSGNYRGTLYGAAENKVEFLWPSGGAGAANLPMHTIIEDIKRELASLWLGEDLSTMSRSGSQRNLGASLQGDEREKRERGDCARISDTLNATIDPIVIHWYFGDATPVLAKFVLESPINEDRALLGNLVAQTVSLGAKVPIDPVAKRLGVPIAQAKEEVFTAPKVMSGETPDTQQASINAAFNAQSDLDRFLGSGPEGRKLRDDYFKAFAGDLQPLRTAMEAVLADDYANDRISFNSKVAWLRGELPSLLKQINSSPKSADALAEILRTAFERGFQTAEESRKL